MNYYTKLKQLVADYHLTSAEMAVYLSQSVDITKAYLVNPSSTQHQRISEDELLLLEERVKDDVEIYQLSSLELHHPLNMTWKEIEDIRRGRDKYIYSCKIIYLKNELNEKDKNTLREAVVALNIMIFITDGQAYSVVDFIPDEKNHCLINAYDEYCQKIITESKHIEAIQGLLGGKTLQPGDVVDIKDEDQLHIAHCITAFS
tara:strand:- start:27 stop:635 length:609 start_codon:yes stop_codon:yes gene_type:complete